MFAALQGARISVWATALRPHEAHARHNQESTVCALLLRMFFFSRASVSETLPQHRRDWCYRLLQKTAGGQKLRLEWYWGRGGFLLLQQRLKHPREMSKTPKASTSNLFGFCIVGRADFCVGDGATTTRGTRKAQPRGKPLLGRLLRGGAVTSNAGEPFFSFLLLLLLSFMYLFVCFRICISVDYPWLYSSPLSCCYCYHHSCMYVSPFTYVYVD